MSFDVVGSGLCAWDTILLFNRFPGPNEKWVVSGRATSGGGPVPTALAIFSRLGGSAAFSGAVGDDQEGLKIRCDLSHYGVDTSHLLMRPDRCSPCAYIWVDKRNGDRTVALDPGDVHPPDATELPEELLRSTPLLLIDGRHTAACLRAAEICRSAGGKVVLDAGSPRADIDTLLSLTDHAIVSHDFITGTYGDYDIADAISQIAAHGPSSVVATLGEKGGIWKESNDIGRYDSFQVDVVDTTGAGDAFHGAYLYGLKRGWPMERRCRFAAAVAAMICTKLGGRTAAPTYDEVGVFMSKSAAPS
ncbi:hypothetical protein KKA00_06985 [bacterium]|nr:hypothetical protein [bacterium]MBU1651948.1 hypothetical protein [bacterium]MBU1881868.1 hypothetical protein [bacterium]